MKYRNLLLLTSSLVLLTAGGCASTTGGDKAESPSSTATASPSQSSSATEYSGFLPDYSKLSRDPNHANTLEWIIPDFAKTEYTGIIIAPVVTHLDPKLVKDGVKLDPEVMNRITSYFHQALVREFSRYLTVTDTAGNDVLRYRAAITGVDANRDMGDNPLDFLPIVLVARTAAGANSVKAHVFMESLYSNSMNGQLVGEVVQSATGEAAAEGISLDSVKSALDAWAKKAADGTHNAMQAGTK